MEKVKTIFKSRPKLIIGLVIVLALSLPFVVNQVLKQQDVRQHADSAPAISFNFSPPIIISPQGATGLTPGSTFDIDLWMSTQPNEDIGAVQFTLNYDTAKLSAPTLVSQGTGLKIVQNPTAPAGKYSAVMVNVNATPQVTGTNLSIIRLRFNALAAGTAQISLDSNILATASLYTTYVPVNNPTGIVSIYTINASGGSITPSPTITAVPSPTQTVATSPTPTHTPTPTLTPLPTATPIPVPTIGSDQTALQVSLSLPGIGTKANLGENNSPHRRTRIATAVVLDSSDIAVTTEKTGVLTYNSTTGRYDGYISLGSSIATPSGSYNVKIKMDNTLYKRAPGIVTINKLTPNNSVLPFELVPGDITGPQINANNTIELLDYNLLGACYRGEAACTSSVAIIADFNDDGILVGDDVDSNIMSRGFYIQNGD